MARYKQVIVTMFVTVTAQRTVIKDAFDERTAQAFLGNENETRGAFRFC